MSNRVEKAKELFVSGYTCSQAVLLAFSDVTGLDDAVAAKLASGFGGGMGGLRNVCGAVTGMIMAANMLYGFDIPGNQEHKTALYNGSRSLAEAFEEQQGTLLCKELLAHLPGKLSADPAVRDDAYYKVRPCALYVAEAVQLLEAYMQEVEPV